MRKKRKQRVKRYVPWRQTIVTIYRDHLVSHFEVITWRWGKAPGDMAKKWIMQKTQQFAEVIREDDL